MRFHCPHCGAPINRFRLFVSKGAYDCPRCGGGIVFESVTEKMRILPYILLAVLLMEVLRDHLHPLVRLALIFGPPSVFMPMVLRIRKNGTSTS